MLACPTSSHKAYCQDAWVENVKAFTYPKLDILIVDNSADLRNVERLKCLFKNCKHNVIIEYRTPLKTVRDTIAECCNYIKDIVNTGGYDYWFSLESDLFPPVNIIEHLLAYNKPVVLAPYFTEYKTVCLLSHEVHNCDGYPFLEQKLPLKVFVEDVKGQLKPVLQGGLGCVLVRNYVLKQVTFRIDRTEWECGFHDYFFHADLMRLQITVWCDYSIFIEHINSSKRWAYVESKQKL